MRKLGIIGGMSWLSTKAYYDRINRQIQKKGTPIASAPLLIESLDYSQLYNPREDAEWDKVAGILVESARRLEGAGAQGLIITSNSMHRVYDRIAEAVSIPILHVADSLGKAIAATDSKNAALLGTRYVMTESFYRQRLVAQGVQLVAPDPEDIDMVDGIIFKELMLGRVTRDAERALKSLITTKDKQGADAIALACTELELVVSTNANVLPVFDSTIIHSDAAAEWILADG